MAMGWRLSPSFNLDDADVEFIVRRGALQPRELQSLCTRGDGSFSGQ